MLRTMSLIFALCVAFAATLAPDANAQQKKGAAKPDLAKLGKELESGDEQRVLAALDQIAKAQAAAKPVAPQIDKLLQRGSNVKIAVKALEVAGTLGQPGSSSAIAPYVQHRSPEARRAAARALIETRGPKAVAALRKALRSYDPQVRGIAATGLGSLGAKESITDLFSALDHNLVEAAGAIGQLCAVEECEKLAARIGKLPLEVLTSGIDRILFRAPGEIPDQHKIAIVRRLRELGSQNAVAYLLDVAKRWPENWSKQVKHAIDAAVEASSATATEDR
jgi:HEAT repeat protein